MREALDMIYSLIYTTMEVGSMGDLFFPRIQAQGWDLKKQNLGVVIQEQGGYQAGVV